ncbi:MAG: GAF domain-containing protein [Fimbriimonadaceae bacterium]|nr:GAF domain-containing protein [Fimbriimonadaceae bacterium]
MSTRTPLLKAVHLASRKLASSGNFDTLLKEVLEICVEAVGASGGTIYLHDKEKRRLAFRHVLPEEVAGKLPPDLPDDYGVVGKVFQTRKTEISHFETARGSDEEGKTGVVISTMITVPLMLEDEEPLGVVQLINKKGGDFDESDAMVLDTVSAISTMAYLNTRLLDESTRASQLLGMGQIAHDIKNLAFALEANVTFSDYTLDEIDLHASKSDDAGLKNCANDIRDMFGQLTSSIDRVKRYSTLISDLSAGKELKPQLALAKMNETIQLSAAFMESEGRSRGIELKYDIQDSAPAVVHDEMYVFRIVQNLVSNAIKATSEVIPESDRVAAMYGDGPSVGEVIVRYGFDDGWHHIEIQDKGPGMTPEIAEKILRGNMRSVWSNNSGSGWGTKIVLKLAESLDAKVGIESELGRGSTFRISLPHRTELSRLSS